MSVAIRPATLDDLPVIKAMMREFVDYLNAIDEPEDVPDEEIAHIESMAFGDAAPCRILIAQLDGNTAGYLTYFWGMSMDGVAPALFVGDLFIKAEHRKRQVGRDLMEHARAIALAAGATQVNWTVWRKNRAAQAFYRSIGAREYSEEILMTWPAGPSTGKGD